MISLRIPVLRSCNSQQIIKKLKKKSLRKFHRHGADLGAGMLDQLPRPKFDLV